MLINTELFKINPKEIPKLPPQLSDESLMWWREQKRRCIEGYWVGGKFMPPRFYFYINFWTIQLNDKLNPKRRIYARPELWDIHWEISEGLMVARGFIGFEKELDVQEALKLYKEGKVLELREYLDNMEDPFDKFNKPYQKDMGKPVYLRDNKDFMLFGSRGSGKSFYIGGAEIGHGFLFDNATEYPTKEVESSVTVVGAEDTKFSGELLKKTKIGMDNLPGKCIIHSKHYPSPLTKEYIGTFGGMNKISAERKVREGENWVTKGTRSSILHVSFRDNPFAAAGTSANSIYIEEAGLCGNLLQIKEATEDCVVRAGVSFGSRIYLGTGGDMDGGTIPSSMMFTDPGRYNIVSYPDIYENRGNIGYFIPSYKALQNFKNKDGITDLEAAKHEIERVREQVRKKSKSSAALDAEKQNKPIVPSEMFLSKTGNIFPTAELQKHEALLLTDSSYLDATDVGEFIYDEEGKLEFKILPKDRYINKFPHNPKEDDIRGAWRIFEHPFKNDDGSIPSGLYIAGTDPYDHNESGTMSLGSTFIYKKIISAGRTMELIVAEYTGRHERGSDAFYEQIKRGLIYFNATNMHENANIGLYKYFEHTNYTYLLMEVPEYAKEVVGKQPNRQKGMHFGVAQITHGELLIKNWLEEEISPGVLQLTKIKSLPLIKELIMYNRKDNFDRVRAFMCAMYARQETMRMVIKSAEESKVDENSYFHRNWKKPNNNAIPENEKVQNSGIFSFKRT